MTDQLTDSIMRMLLGPRPVQIERTDVAGLTVSTIKASDHGGYETAILAEDQTIPVEYYDLEALARAGHARWVAKAPTLTTVTQLPWKAVDPDGTMGTGEANVPIKRRN